ncbi:MAG TPA: C25 family cysteine peptidase [Caldisericia bacterium]|nr:C25 family cysteine peptidase [Caldisericia bacterium]
MKKLFSVILVFAIVAPGITFAAPNTPVKTDIPLGGLLIGNPGGFSKRIDCSVKPELISVFRGQLFATGLSRILEIGMPVVPSFTERIQVPNGSYPKGAYLKEISFTNIPLPELEPYYPKTWGKEPGTQKQIELKGFFPKSLGDMKVENGNDGQIATIYFNPIVLDFDKRMIRVAKRAIIDVVFESNTTYSPSPEKPQNKAVIICPNSLIEAAKKLEQAQKNDGYTVRTVTVEEIASTFEPQKEEPSYKGPKDFSEKDKKYLAKYDYELAKKIRNFCAKESLETSFITILGDGLLVPASFYYLENYSSLEYDRYVPSDIFYASPDLDTVPNMSVGRLPVRNLKEANDIVDKIIRYRKSIKPEWFKKIVLSGGDPFSGGFLGELECQSLVDNGYLDGFGISKNYKTRDSFDSKSLLKAFTEDNGLVYCVSHGAGNAIITEPGKVTNTDIMGLPKRDKLPVLVSVACTNGMFDNSVVGVEFKDTPEYKDISFAQACLFSQGGPVAYFGGSRLNYAGINWTIEGGVAKALPFDEIDRLMTEVVNAYNNWATTLGELYSQALKKYVGVAKEGFFTTSKSLFCFTFLGDPTIKLPQNSGGAPHRMPDVEVLDCPITSDGLSIPIMSVVEPNQVLVKTDFEWIESRKIDLETAKSQPVQKLTNPTNKTFRVPFSHNTKSLWQARIELPNSSEVWIYYITRAKYDLKAVSNRLFYTDKPSKRQNFSFQVINEGYKDLQNIIAQLKIDGITRKTKKIGNLEINSLKQLNFTIEGLEEGEHTVNFEVKSDIKDDFPKDNVFEKQLVLTKSETAKALCLISYLFNASTAKKIFGIDSYEKSVKDFKKIPTEIVTYGDDSYMSLLFGFGYQDFAELGADTVIMASPNFANPYDSKFVKVLFSFVENGGQAIGYACLGSESGGSNYTAYAKVFGFKQSLEYGLSEDSFTFDVPIDPANDFFQGMDGMSAKAIMSNTIPAQSWDECLDGAKIVSKSKDVKSIIATNGGNSIYFSTLYENTNPEHFRFLYNLLTYSHRPQPDVSLYSGSISCDPPVALTSSRVKVDVSIVNSGNVASKEARLVLEPFGFSKTVPQIEKGSKTNLEFEIETPDSPGILELGAKIAMQGEVNEKNNDSTYRLQVLPKGREGSLEAISNLNISDFMILPDKPFYVTGKAQKGALINCQGSLARVSDKGDFKVYVKPSGQGLELGVTTIEGFSSSKKINCTFATQKNVAGTIGKNYFIQNQTYTKDLKTQPFFQRNNETYVNFTVVGKTLGLDITTDGDKWSFGNSSFTMSGTLETGNAKIEMGGAQKDVQSQQPIMMLDSGLCIPASFLSQISFKIEQDNKPGSFLVLFPNNVKLPETPLEQIFSNGFARPETKELRMPKETDYGPPVLLSYGALDGEVKDVMSLSPTKKGLYLLTSRGVELWTAEGVFSKCIGFPPTLVTDVGGSWYSFLYSNSNSFDGKTPKIAFAANDNDNFAFATQDCLAVYDEKLKLVKKYKFDDPIYLDVGIQTDSKGNFYYLDQYNSIWKVDQEDAEPINLVDSDGEDIDEFFNFTVLPNGNIAINVTEGLKETKKWSALLFDPTGKLLGRKDFTINPEKALEEEVMSSIQFPTALLSMKSGGFYAIYTSYDALFVEKWDEQFELTDKKIIQLEGIYVNSVYKTSSDNFYMAITAGFMEEGLSENKFKICKVGPDFKTQLMVPFIVRQSNRLVSPYFMEFSEDGDLYMGGEQKCVVYDRFGTRKDDFVISSGDEKTAFKPVMLKFDSGKIVVLSIDYFESNIIISDKGGNLLRKISLSGENGFYPYAIEPNLSQNEIYILDGMGKIHVIPSYLDQDKNPEGFEPKKSVSIIGYGKGLAQAPVAMRYFNGKLYVLDFYGQKVCCYDKDLNFLFEFGGLGEGTGLLMDAISLCTDNNGNIWVGDMSKSKLVVYSGDGGFLGEIGKEGFYTSPGSIEAYSNDSFSWMSPLDFAIGKGGLAVFDYGHDRILMWNSKNESTTMSITPDDLKMTVFPTQKIFKYTFEVTNTGSGNLEGTISSETGGVTIVQPKIIKNIHEVVLECDFSNMDIPKSINVVIQTNVGTKKISIPITIVPLDVLLVVGEPVCGNANGVFRLAMLPYSKNDKIIVSTKDLEKMFGLKGIIAKDNNSAYFTYGQRRIGFVNGSSIADFQVGEDHFNVNLGVEVTKLIDGGLTVPVETIAAFLSCKVIPEDNFIKMTAR